MAPETPAAAPLGARSSTCPSHKCHLGARTRIGRSRKCRLGARTNFCCSHQVPLGRSPIYVQPGVPHAAAGLYLPYRSCYGAEGSSSSGAERSTQQRPQSGAAYALNTAATEPPAAALRSTERPCAPALDAATILSCCALAGAVPGRMALQAAAPVLEATACELHGSAA